MWWHYVILFVCAVGVDVFPLPLPPAFTVMVLFQILFGLDIWPVIFVGVTGSVLGRYILTLYISGVSEKIFNKAKTDDIHYLGRVMQGKGWKGRAGVLIYSLLPLPTTPIFIAAGMANVKPGFIIPSFIAGKLISDTMAVFMGKFAHENIQDITEGIVNWKSVTGLILGLLLLGALLFVNWRTLLHENRLALKFNIWKN